MRMVILAITMLTCAALGASLSILITDVFYRLIGAIFIGLTVGPLGYYISTKCED